MLFKEIFKEMKEHGAKVKLPSWAATGTGILKKKQS